MEKAIIGAAVALFIFTISQVLIYLRDKQQFRREKLEELFDALNEVSICLSESLYGAQKFKEDGDLEDAYKYMRAVDRSLHRPRTFLILYFSYFTSGWEELIIKPIFVYVDFFNNAIDDRDSFKLEDCSDRVNELSLKIRYAQNFLAKNTELTSTSIFFHFRRVFLRKVKINL